MNKKIIKSIGAVALGTIPLAFAVSCNSTDDKKGIIVVSVPNTATSVNAMMKKLAVEEADKYGYRAQGIETNEDVNQEYTKIKTLVDTGKVKGLIMAPAQASGSKRIIKYAKQKGVKVTTMDRIVDSEGEDIIVDGRIFTNDADVADKLVDHAVTDFNSWYGKFKDENTNTEAVAKHPGWAVASNNTKNAKEAMKKLNIIISSGDASSSTAIGRLEGLQSAVLRKIYGIDAVTAKKNLKDGTDFKLVKDKGGYLSSFYAEKWAADKALALINPLNRSINGDKRKAADMIFTASTPNSQSSITSLKKFGSDKGKSLVYAFDAENKLKANIGSGEIAYAEMQRFDLFTKWSVARLVYLIEKDNNDKNFKKAKISEVKADNFNGGQPLDYKKADLPIGTTTINKDNLNEMLF